RQKHGCSDSSSDEADDALFPHVQPHQGPVCQGSSTPRHVEGANGMPAHSIGITDAHELVRPLFGQEVYGVSLLADFLNRATSASLQRQTGTGLLHQT